MRTIPVNRERTLQERKYSVCCGNAKLGSCRRITIPLSLDTSTTRTGHQHLPAEKHACGHGECGMRFREIALYLLFCQGSHGEIFKFCFFLTCI